MVKRFTRRGRDSDDGVGGIYADEAEGRKALSYSRTREWLALIDLVLGITGMTLALVTGASARLRDATSRVPPKRVGGVIPYAAVGIVASSLASLPMAFYEGYVIEHKYGLSNQSKRAWLADWLKGVGVGLALGAPLIGGMYWVIRKYPKRWWAVLSALVVPFTVLLANLAPVLLMPLFNKFEPIKDR